MVGIKRFLAGAVAVIVAADVQAQAAVTVSVLSDTGTLVTTTYAPPASNSSSVPTPFGSGAMTITPFTAGWKVSFNPSSGFFVSANNLAGGKTSTLEGMLAFDIDFGTPINLTANVFEQGIYSVAGDGNVSVISPALPAGITITQLDNPLIPESKTKAFKDTAYVNFNANAGTWLLYDQVNGFTKPYTKYHVVVDNSLLAESLVNVNQAPGFATIAKKNFSIIFTTDGSNGGGPNVPEPTSLGVLALGCMALLARRRK